MTKMNELEVLIELGLSPVEARVYLTLLQTGSTRVGAVIRKTGFHRGTTYQVLHRLAEKGLVSSVVKGKKQFFEAANPDRLGDMLKEKEAQLDEILPVLKAKAGVAGEKQEVAVYYGTAGIKSVLDKMLFELGQGGKYCDFGVSGLFKKMLPAYWSLWQKRKKRLHISSNVIFNEDVRFEHPGLLAEYVGRRRFPPRESASLTDTMIYRDTVILFIWTALPPIAIIIKNKENAKSYQNQFELMWKNAKR